MVYCGSFHQYAQFFLLINTYNFSLWTNGMRKGTPPISITLGKSPTQAFLCCPVSTLSPLPTQVLLGPMVPVWWGVSLQKKRSFNPPEIRALFHSHCCLCKVFFQPCLSLKERVKIKKIKNWNHLQDGGNILEGRLAQWLVLVWKSRGVQGRELDIESVKF